MPRAIVEDNSRLALRVRADDKATLMRATYGRLWIEGINIREEPEQARRHIGFLSHNTYLYRDLNPVENLGDLADHVRGFILGHRYRGDSGHIITIDVDPTLQRSGLGSTLIQALEEQFRSAGCKSILLEVAVNNHTALTFYKKHGYSVLKTLRRYYRGDLDALLMGKAIHPQDL